MSCSLVFRCHLAWVLAVVGVAPVAAQDPFGGDDFGMFVPVDDAVVAGLSGRSVGTFAGGDESVRRVRRVALDVEAFSDPAAVLDRGGSPPVVRLTPTTRGDCRTNATRTV